MVADLVEVFFAGEEVAVDLVAPGLLFVFLEAEGAGGDLGELVGGMPLRLQNGSHASGE